MTYILRLNLKTTKKIVKSLWKGDRRQEVTKNILRNKTNKNVTYIVLEISEEQTKREIEIKSCQTNVTSINTSIPYPIFVPLPYPLLLVFLDKLS